MVNTFTSAGAVPVTIEVLEATGFNEQAAELKEKTGHSKSNIVKYDKYERNERKAAVLSIVSGLNKTNIN